VFFDSRSDDLAALVHNQGARAAGPDINPEERDIPSSVLRAGEMNHTALSRSIQTFRETRSGAARFSPCSIPGIAVAERSRDFHA
jgi:hypothetical protein